MHRGPPFEGGGSTAYTPPLPLAATLAANSSAANSSTVNITAGLSAAAANAVLAPPASSQAIPAYTMQPPPLHPPTMWVTQPPPMHGGNGTDSGHNGQTLQTTYAAYPPSASSMMYLPLSYTQTPYLAPYASSSSPTSTLPGSHCAGYSINVSSLAAGATDPDLTELPLSLNTLCETGLEARMLLLTPQTVLPPGRPFCPGGVMPTKAYAHIHRHTNNLR